MTASVALVPHACPSDRLRMWVGVTRPDGPPVIEWSLDGVRVQPRSARELKPTFKGLEMQLAVPADDVWTGIVEFAFQHIGILSLEFHVDKLSRPLL